LESSIRATATVVTHKLRLETTASRKRLFTRISLKLKRRAIRNSILATNVLILIAVFAVVIHSTSSAQVVNQEVVSSVNSSNNSNSQDNPLDELSSSQIAVQVANMTGIYEGTSVANLADSQSAAANVVPSDSQVISKPTIIATNDAKSRLDIVKYVTQPGDTLNSLAVKFGVTSNSISWSNSLSGNDLSTGLTLYIPPINGIVYTVKSGDTATSLAQKYNADANQITSFNNAELTGLTPGEQVVIPSGSVQVASSNAYAGDYYGGSSYSFGYGPVYGYNGYDYGYCTWWVAEKRAQAGVPVPANLGDASTWYALAQASGIPTGGKPEVDSVIWFGYYANHVGFVQSVNADGSITISEMNRIGWDIADTRTIPASEAASYKYIY
jgi:N-acetylmuramoyl-L-alanine amidase